MSRRDPVVAVLAQLVFATDGAVMGVVLAYAAFRTWRSYTFNSSALAKIHAAPTVRISDLRSLLDHDSEPPDQNLLVLVRGVVKSLTSHVLESTPSSEHKGKGIEGVILQRTQKCIYSDWIGPWGSPFDMRAIISKNGRDQDTMSLAAVPFVLVERGQSDNVIVKLDSAIHPLPLVTVYSHLEPNNATTYTVLHALLGLSYPIAVCEEEKILPLGKEISAVGFCSFQEGNPQIEHCEDLPYFLSDMTKEQMVVAVTYKTNLLFWGGIVLGSFSLGILGYAITRNWRKWKHWREQKRLAQSRNDALADATNAQVDEETGEVPEGQLCVICLMRRRKSAFVPCGHLVCCHRCALVVERDTTPKCPVCRQSITSCVRIYDS